MAGNRRLHRERSLIERFFSKLKHHRRVAARYGELAEIFLAMVKPASVRLWLRTMKGWAEAAMLLPIAQCRGWVKAH